jgi:curved DNA-binding protein CbpA
LSNYYEILGLLPNAGSDEIKAAFRRLAKQYHPDKNPNGKEFFEKVLIAYETLSDPASKASYDYRLANNLPQPETQRKPGTKTWKFTEQELKRRQYYNDHIRKYAKATASYNAQAETRKDYNEYRYILLALPLAVALFLLIMRIASPERKSASPSSAVSEKQAEEAEVQRPRQGDSPYGAYFGEEKYFQSGKRNIKVRNHTGEQIIVCIFSDTSFVRSFFMESGFSAEVMQLPATPLTVSYSSGRDFDYLKRPDEPGVQGGFTTGQRYFMSREPLAPGGINELTLLPGNNELFVPVSGKEFFGQKIGK